MAYAPNYYNYQVFVIFAIVLAAALLLAAVVGAIYFICVANMRKQKGFSRAPSALSRSGRYGGGGVWQAQPIEPQPQSIIVGGSPGYDTNVPPTQPSGPYDYQRSQPSPYSAAAAAITYSQPQQQQQPQTYTTQPYQPQYSVPPQTQQMHPDMRIRDIHPEYAYQQGPITWSSTGPIPQQQPEATQNFHMSSV